MQLLLTVDWTNQKPDAILALVYAFSDLGDKFAFTGNGESVTVTLDGSKLLSSAAYNAVIGFPYTLTFAVPPVPPSPPAS